MTKIFDLVPGWVYAAAIAILLGLCAIQWTTSASRISDLEVKLAKANQAHSDYVTKQTQLNKEAADKAREREQELQAEADKDRHESQNRINRLRAERDAALAELRNRPARPQAAGNGIVLPSPAGPGAQAQHCTGADLYRDDAEFLVGIAADFKELAIKYDELWALYERARAQTTEAVRQ